MADENQAPDDINGENEQTPTAEGVEVNTELSRVASNPKRNMAIMAIFGVIFVYIIYQIIASQQPDTAPTPPPLAVPTQVFKPNTSVSDDSSTIPAVPELPKLVKPTAAEESVTSNAPPLPQPVAETPAMPNVPNIPSAPSSIPFINSAPVDTKAEQQKRAEAKRKSSMLLINGTPETLTPEEQQIKSNFTYRGNLSQVLGRGKVIDAVLESAINSDFPGEILALVSRDVYAEDGKIILIPKGSRVIGDFSISSAGGDGRVEITWSRIDLPSGFSVNIASNTVDNLGRKGVQGRVDNKYKEQFANVVLSSAFSIALASTLDKIVPPVPSNNTASNQTTIATAISTAIATSSTSSDPATQITAICGSAKAGLASYPTTLDNVNAACNTASATVGTQGAAAVSTLITSLNSIAAGNVTAAATASTPSQTQQASIDAFKDISSKVSDVIVKDNQFTPTVTVNQGEHIKIYVNKDYLFPLKAINKSRVMQ
jgi:type IV secretion system protein VirB10